MMSLFFKENQKTFECFFVVHSGFKRGAQATGWTINRFLKIAVVSISFMMYQQEQGIIFKLLVAANPLLLL